MNHIIEGLRFGAWTAAAMLIAVAGLEVLKWVR